jgi:hypothetical protein
MKPANQIRQGDVLLERVVHTLSPEAKPRPRDHGRVVLAYGEVTGHAHALAGPLTELFEEHDGALYLRIEATDELRHVDSLESFRPTGEHDAHTLEPGMYRVVNQREYAPGEIRRVAD